MEEAREQDQYTERLKEVFHSFDASDTGSLSPEELSDLCQSLHLGEATPALLHALLQTQDCLTGRVDFNRFKNALILVLSSRIEAPRAGLEAFPPPDSPEIQPKFVKGSKRYGRRSTPETILGFSEVPHHRLAEGDVLHGNNEDSPFPRKRERWNAHETSTEEYEAVGELQLWNPDEPTTPRRSMVPLSDRLEEKLQQACEELSLPWDGLAEHDELLALCDHIALEITGDVIQSLTGDGVMNVKEFVSRVVNHSTPPTPSSSTPYRQLKRHHSTQTFDETGRRITTPSSMTSTLSLRLFSTLDDGTGHTLAEDVLDAWFQEGVRNSAEILQALDFSLDGKLNLTQLTTALENELLVTKNGIHQAALASFKAEIRHLLERVDLELREKEKVCSNLEKAEKLKSQLATEVDERHSAIERTNNLNLRKLEQDHKEKLAATRLELITEMDRIQQQAGLQREKLEAEVQKVREDEVLLRDHLSMSVKENRRLEMDLLDSSERLTEAQSQITKLQTNLEKVLKEKFGGLDPCSVDFFLQDERIKQLRNSYEAQCRELQDRIDELHSELQEFHTLGRLPQPCSKPLSEDLESKSPGMESDPGLGSDEGQPFIMSLEAEMMLEALKEQHLREMEDLRAQLDSKMGEFDQKIEEQKAAHDTQKAAISLQHQEEIQALREEIAIVQRHAQKLQNQVELEQASLEKRHAKEQEELEDQQDQEVGTLRQQLLEAHMHAADLEEQLSTLEAQQAQIELNLDGEMEKLKRHHALDLRKLEERREVLLEARLEEERMRTQEEIAGVQKGLQEDWEREKDRLQQNHKVELSARLEEAAMRFQEESDALVKRLTDEWQRERSQLDEQRNESLQAVLEEEMMRLIKEHEEKERKLREQWEGERAQLLKSQEEVLLARLTEETLKVHGQSEQREKKLKEEWEIERLQLEEDYEGMLQERLDEEREKLEAEKEEVGKQLERLLNKEKTLLEESHREALQELSAKHSEERAELHQLLDKLRGEIIEERKELESHFTHRIKEVEHRFSGDQESLAERFQVDVLNLEQHYQRELKALSGSHAQQKVIWEAEMESALEEVEEQRRLMREAMERERRSLNHERVRDRDELENIHKVEIEELLSKKQDLQKELNDCVCLAQTKEIELSRQLNDLHKRLQESLETRDELLALAERKALELEFLLNQAVEDFRQERAELQSSLSDLDVKYKEALSLSEKRLAERVDLSHERDNLKIKIEGLEMTLKQAAEDFEVERQELEENLAIIEEKLKHSLSCCDSHENQRVKLFAERDLLNIRIEDLKSELARLLATTDITERIEIQKSDVNGQLAESFHCGDISSEEQEQPSNPIENISDNCNVEVLDIPDNDDALHVEYVESKKEAVIAEIPIECKTHSDNNSMRDDPPNLEASVKEQSQDEDSERIVETPNSIGGCSVDTDCFGDECDESGAASEDDDHYPMVETNGKEQEESGDVADESDACAGHAGGGCGEEWADEVDAVPDHRGVGKSGSGGRNRTEEDEDDKPFYDEDLRPRVSPLARFSNPKPSSISQEAGDGEGKGVQCDYSWDASPHDYAAGDAVDRGTCSAIRSCDGENKPAGLFGGIVVEFPAPKKAGGPIAGDEEVGCLSLDAHGRGKQCGPASRGCEQAAAGPVQALATCVPSAEQQRKRGDCEDDDGGSLVKLRGLYGNAIDENVLLQQKISLLQQKADTLENIVSYHSEKMETGSQALEENYNLKVKMIYLMGRAKELETKAVEINELQVRYEDSVYENGKLKQLNGELKKRLLGLESKISIVQDFKEEHMSLLDEIASMREENGRLSEVVSDLERQDEILSAAQEAASSRSKTPEEPSPEPDYPPPATVQGVADMENCCTELELQNAGLRRALTDLQDKSLSLNGSMLAHRSETSRLAEENLKLGNRISALKDEDLKEAKQDLLQRLEHFRMEKSAAEEIAESLKKQISELHLRSQQLEDENELLSQKNEENVADVEEISQQLAELMQENDRREAAPAEDRSQMAACVSALEAELTKALEDSEQLKERNSQLTQQLSGLGKKLSRMDTVEEQLKQLLQERRTSDKETQGLRNQLVRIQERAEALDESLQAVNLQTARLKSDLRVTQQEKDALRHEVVSLHKQLQNAKDKNQILEIALHSSGFQNQHKKLYQEEMSRLLDQEQHLLRQDNERLQMEVCNTKGDLVHSREKVRQLETTVVSMKQQKNQSQSCLLKALEEENASLKQELESKAELDKSCDALERQDKLETLQQENDALKTQMTRLSSQLLEAFQAQLVGLLPPSPHRIPRAPRADDPDNMQDEKERERTMKRMEERMREIELSLHNVKLLLREKVAQLKEQLHKNGQADTLIRDLYVENNNLLKALEITEQRHKITEKRNYLLEEKIASLNKIVRELHPAPLPPAPLRFKCA